jgi:hypothetical protein
MAALSELLEFARTADREGVNPWDRDAFILDLDESSPSLDTEARAAVNAWASTVPGVLVGFGAKGNPLGGLCDVTVHYCMRHGLSCGRWWRPTGNPISLARSMRLSTNK